MTADWKNMTEFSYGERLLGEFGGRERERVAVLASVLDQATFSVLESIGVALDGADSAYPEIRQCMRAVTEVQAAGPGHRLHLGTHATATASRTRPG